MVIFWTYSDSGDFYANVEHLAHGLDIGVVATEDLIPAGELGVGHVFQAVGGERAVVEELGARAPQQPWKKR